MVSQWQSMTHRDFAFNAFHIITLKSNAALAMIPLAVGCHLTIPTFRWCPRKSTKGSRRSSVNPPDGIRHILIVQSSDAEAMMWSLNGFHWMSRISRWCPATRGSPSFWWPTFMEGNQHMYVRESENFVWLYNLTKFGAACSAWPIVLQSWIIDYWLFVQQSTLIQILC